MPISAAEIEDFRAQVDALPENATDHLLAITEIPELIAYVVHVAREEGEDELEAVELIVRAGETSPDDRKRSQAVLKPLGYLAVAALLGKLARRKRHTPKYETGAATHPRY
jgi:hypothetical protein